MTSAHHFIDISQNILNMWMRLIFPETRHPGLQFEHKNETILIRIELDMIFWSWLYRQIQQLWKNWILTCSSLPPIFTFDALEMRSRFMILCQPSLNSLPFIFSSPLLYNPPSPSFQSTDKTPLSSPLLSSRKFSSLVISWSSWDSRYWVRLTLPLLTLLFRHP